MCISAITEGELRFGLARRPEAVRLARVVEEFLLQGRRTALGQRRRQDRYGQLRRHLESAGTPMGALDILIAAHALAADAILVTSDAAFARAP